MLVIGRSHSLEPRALRRDRIAHPIIRKTLALAKSRGPTLYLVSVGLIATWVIGVFFGVGFLFLMHPHAKKEASQLGVGGAHLSTSLLENPGVFLSMIGTDELFSLPSEAALGDRGQIVAASDKTSPIFNDLHLVTRAEPFADQVTTDPISSPLSSGLNTTLSVLDKQLPGSSAPSHVKGTGPRTVAPPYKPHQIPPTSDRTSPVHPPVQAIHDLLQKQPGLLK
jgi:hypothetical protein